jgi:hypothetical protein
MVNQHSMATRGKVGFCQPATLLSTVVSPISKTYRSALADTNWRAAMEDEYAALLSNNTWNLVPRPQAPMWPQASGFFGLSTMLTALWIATRLDQCFVVSPNDPVLIMMRPSTQW